MMNPNLLEKLKDLLSKKTEEEEQAIAEKEARIKRAEKEAKEYSIRQAKRLRGEKVEEPEEAEEIEEVKVLEESKSPKEQASSKKTEKENSLLTRLKAGLDTEEIEESDEVVNDNYQAPKKFPVKQRLLVILVALVIASLFGLGIGYSVVGEGRFIDILKPSTWTHLYKIING